MPDTLDTTPPQRRHIAWLWFAYTGFLFIDPYFEHRLALWVAMLLVLGIFAVIFAAYTRCDEDDPSSVRYWLIAATFLLGLIAFTFNGGASTLFVYAAGFLPFTIRSTRRVLLLFLGMALVILAETALLQRPVHIAHLPFALHIAWPNACIAIFLLVLIGGANVFFAEQKNFNRAQLRAARKLRDAQAENIALAAVAERERIARDLHDVLGHTLSVITLKAELAGRLLPSDPARAAAEIADVERLARTSLAEVREAITGYRAQGLAAEIDTARRTLTAAGVTLILADTPGPPPTPASSSWVGAGANAPTNFTHHEETTLALALREAVTNIVRHARATTCTLRFISNNGSRRLIVEDNGATAITPQGMHEGNGLRGMRERIESLGGHLTLDHNQGTRLQITLPTSI